MSLVGQIPSFGDVGSMSGLSESGRDQTCACAGDGPGGFAGHPSTDPRHHAAQCPVVARVGGLTTTDHRHCSVGGSRPALIESGGKNASRGGQEPGAVQRDAISS
jgi:hypothetical protein